MLDKTKLKKLYNAFTHYWLWVYKEYLKKECPTAAASITLTSLFAIVPVFLIIINVLNSFDVFNPLSVKIQSFIFDNMLPSTAATVQQYILSLSRSMSSLPIASIFFLLAIIFFTIKNLEGILNKIFSVNKPRPIIQSLLVYWALMTVGPIFFGFVFVSSSYIISTHWISTDLGIEKMLINVVSFLFLVIAFFIIYRILPNTKINSRSALTASLFVAIIFSIAKKVFSLYIMYVPTYSLLYGSLSLIPIFILWMYICWQIVLIGAVMMKGLQLVKINLEFSKSNRRDDLTIAVSILKQLYESQKNLDNAVSIDELYKAVGAHAFDKFKNIVHSLEKSKMIRISFDNLCYSTCDVTTLKVACLYDALEPTINFRVTSSAEINKIKTSLEKSLQITIKDCFTKV